MASEDRNSTIIDPGFGRGDGATIIDNGWNSIVDSMLDPVNLMNKADARAFVDIADFKEAVAKIPQLVSRTDKVYKVKNTLSTRGGESIVLLCEASDGTTVVGKVYFAPVKSVGTSISARTTVFNYMQTEEGKKYTLAVTDIGLVELKGSNYYFEIMPYCEEGDLSEVPPMPFGKIVGLVKVLNEALHSIHSAGIIHRDIKPANIYKFNGKIVIGDFGVAKLIADGVSSTTVGTDYYRAPETYLAVGSGKRDFWFDTKCDYFSLGVTLATFFEGHVMYKNIPDSQITIAVRDGAVPLLKQSVNREKLENLLKGLCRYDPNYRFGYEEVNKWIENHDYTGPVYGAGSEAVDSWPRPFEFLGQKYSDEKSLFEAITKDATHWNEGLEMLYGKYFEDAFRPFKQSLARAAQTADEKYRATDKDMGLFVFLKALYPIGPIVWKGRTFHSLSELAEKLLITTTPAGYGDMLRSKCISYWLEKTEKISVDSSVVTIVRAIENYAASEPEIACYWFGNSFASARSLKIAGTEVTTIDKLIKTLFGNPASFYNDNIYEKTMDKHMGKTLYGFLYSYGFKDVIEKAFSEIAGLDSFNKTVTMLGIWDDIAVKAGADPSPIRHFFANYGPIGMYTYVQKIIAKYGDEVYMPVDDTGRKAISAMRGIYVNEKNDVKTMYKNSLPLIAAVDKMRSVLNDNPFCIETGVYEKEGVICTNLLGCFAFKMFDRPAPLGYQAYIISGKGEV